MLFVVLVNKVIPQLFTGIIFLMCISTSSYAESLSNNMLNIYQVMQRVFDRYPTLKISEIDVSKAKEQRQQVESQLGWILNSSAGVTHDLTGLGTPSDSFDINASINRRLKSGATLSLSGGYRYEDSSLSFSPVLPNPAHTTNLDLSYRLPLSQGESNPLYNEGIISAELGYELAKANQLLIQISLAEKVKELYYASALTHVRLINAEESVRRAKKLETYVNKNFKLGLSEEKDRLQARAQLRSKLADLSAIKLVWKKQKLSLNRLMLEGWEKEFQPRLLKFKNFNGDLNKRINMTKDYHPAVKIAATKLALAESQINTARDTKKDNLDLVVSVGTRTSNGTNTSGSSISEQDWAGAVRFEYTHLFDDKGVSSKFKQAQLQKTIALHEIQNVNDDIRYTVSGLLAEIQAAKYAVTSALEKLNSESLKLKEVTRRYKSGRADTDQLIQFQNEYSLSFLAYQNQKIGLNERIIALDIFTGRFWTYLNHGSNLQGTE